MITEEKDERREGRLARVGLRFADWCTHWFPDPLVFCFLAVVLVFLLALASGENPAHVAIEGGKSFWSFSNFTMQMVMVVIGGYMVAETRPVRRAVDMLAAVPSNPRSAIALVAFFAMATSLLSWGLSLIFSGRLVRALARRQPGLDYRAAGAAGYLGLGVTSALGLSSSAAMLMATRSSLPPALARISGVIPLTDTLFCWQNVVMTGTLIVVSVGVAYVSAPSAASAKTAAHLGIALAEPVTELPQATTPGERLDRNPVLSIMVAALLVFYLANAFIISPLGPIAALDLNNYNLMFLTAGLILHWRPVNFLRAVSASVPATAGLLIQFPFFALVFGMIANTGLSARISHVFISIGSPRFYPLLVAAYSSTLGIFIPSGGSKWLIEAPYVLEAARAMGQHLGWTVQIYNAAEALPNLINPFFMLPLLGILRCRARDIVGYGILQLIILLPVCYGLTWSLAMTFK